MAAMATLGAGTMELDTCPASSQEVFSRLRQISDDLAAGGGSVVFVDAGGRVVASSTQVSPRASPRL